MIFLALVNSCSGAIFLISFLDNFSMVSIFLQSQKLSFNRLILLGLFQTNQKYLKN